MWIDSPNVNDAAGQERQSGDMNSTQYAMMRESRQEEPMAVSSSRAIVLAARQLVRVLQTHGPQAIALWLSPRTAREAKHLASRFARKALRSARLFADADEARAAMDKGEVRAVWLFGADAAAEAARCRRSLTSMDCVILQDQRYPAADASATAATDVFFPVQRTEDDDAAEARPAWWWIQQVALAMGFRAGFMFATPEQIREEIARGVTA